MMSWTCVRRDSFGSPMTSLWREQRALQVTWSLMMNVPLLSPLSPYLPLENSAGDMESCDQSFFVFL